MVDNKYVPDRGDIVWLNFEPQAGHEQKGKRPAVTISPKIYNEKTGLGLFCPITSIEKGYTFEVKISSQIDVHGVVLADQIKNQDWSARNAEFISILPAKLMREVIAKLAILIE
ncbi:MAG: mRNA-degrading endonuclease [Ignavibacteria bacterium GWB2_35_12]|nr:MAG: mRNA-degrading endonuclease [Ignavibacteria bacterium GWA2_35_8]OGU37854.1 MAG: mRNA-degrading endonuclease [Ignavibacteria bacterium GWB2_35_12]OGU97017.1 MAG: mRNA-degrading endonuclease [Ignavibacteria bacterium RIFOXYA2_FULL_35_10]OGV18852.1 MAG: mRNA-degrading endonuclease [Ignavibacteria bacterium RIFOXYC2_FULL_35_21]